MGFCSSCGTQYVDGELLQKKSSATAVCSTLTICRSAALQVLASATSAARPLQLELLAGHQSPEEALSRMVELLGKQVELERVLVQVLARALLQPAVGHELAQERVPVRGLGQANPRLSRVAQAPRSPRTCRLCWMG